MPPCCHPLERLRAGHPSVAVSILILQVLILKARLSARLITRNYVRKKAYIGHSGACHRQSSRHRLE